MKPGPTVPTSSVAAAEIAAGTSTTAAAAATSSGPLTRITLRLRGTAAIGLARTMLETSIQEGHVAPREPGFEAATGTPREQELVTRIADALAGRLAVDGRFAPLVVPGDIPDGSRRRRRALPARGRLARPDGDFFGDLASATRTTPSYPATVTATSPSPSSTRAHRRPHPLASHGPLDREHAPLRRASTRVADRLAPAALLEHAFLHASRAKRPRLCANVDELAEAEHRALSSCSAAKTHGRLARTRPWPALAAQSGAWP